MLHWLRHIAKQPIPATFAALLALCPVPSLACACGCGIFGVGTLSLIAPDLGGTAFVEYDFMDQNQNWSGASTAPTSNNPDKDIRTNFLTAGAQYMFTSSWGIMAELPYWQRHFATANGAGGVAAFDHSALGDVRLLGVYSGFSEDMSTGIVFGVKLPTGDWTYPNFDRDTSIGTGSTDVLLGAYHAGSLTADNSWSWFAQGMWQHAVATQGGYRPGDEIDAALGVDYSKGVIWGQTSITPTIELLASNRACDTGLESNQPNSGYSRFFIAPGAEVDYQAWKFFASAQVPIVQHFNGDQLAADVLLKFTVGYVF